MFSLRRVCIQDHIEWGESVLKVDREGGREGERGREREREMEKTNKNDMKRADSAKMGWGVKLSGHVENWG